MASDFARVASLLTGNRAVDKAQLARIQKDDPLAFQVLSTQLEHTDRMCGNWRLGNDSRVKDGFWPEFQSAMLGRKDAKTALADAEGGDLGDGRLVTYLPTTRKGFEVKETTFRTLRVKPAKGIK